MVVDANHLFQQLCHEAALACGPDMTAIERYVIARIEGMDSVDRARIRQELDLVLSYRAPDRRDGRAQ
jgi:hypothetical protein